MNKNHVLVVDDEPDIRSLVKDILEDEGFEVNTAESAASARKQLKTHKPDLVLLDIWMSDEDGISLLKEWHQSGNIDFPVLMMSGHGTVEAAIEATRYGAVGFIEKPLTTSKLLQSVNNAMPSVLSSDYVEKRGYEFSGASQEMQDLRAQIEQSAKSQKPILISGEEGTKRLLLAEYIREAGSQPDIPLVVFVPEVQQYWNQIRNQITCVNRDELSSAYERKLIALFQEDPTAFSRLIVLQRHSSEDADTLAKDDLIATLQPLQLHIPPLRKHKEDVPKLISDSIDYCCLNYQLTYRKISIAAQNYLFHYHWPGNQSEMDTLVYELLANGNDGEITLDEVKKVLHHSGMSASWFETMMDKPIREAREMFEKAYLERQLERVGGNISRLAIETNMERTHLYRKLRALGVHYKTGNKSS